MKKIKCCEYDPSALLFLEKAHNILAFSSEGEKD
jgi:hypothetical protein